MSKFGIVSVALVEEVLVLLELVFIVIFVASVSLARILACYVLIGILWLVVLAGWHQ
jgi:hypothetical protein